MLLGLGARHLICRIWDLLVAVDVPRLYWWCCSSSLVMLAPGEIYGVSMSSPPCSIMSWNVRGLNSPAKREAVRAVAASHRLALLCIQETKIDTWDQARVHDIGGSSMQDCVILPAIGTRGGAAIFWDRDLVSVASQAVGIHSITAQVTVLSCSSQFFITTVYGPSDDTNKDEFLAELVRCAPPKVHRGSSTEISTSSTKLETRTILISTGELWVDLDRRSTLRA